MIFHFSNAVLAYSGMVQGVQIFNTAGSGKVGDFPYDYNMLGEYFESFRRDAGAPVRTPLGSDLTWNIFDPLTNLNSILFCRGGCYPLI